MILTNCYRVTTIKRLSELKSLFLAAALIWTLAVTILCLSTFRSLPSIEVEGFDKVGHLIFHIGIVSLWYLYFFSASGLQLRSSLFKAVAFSLAFGIVIELLQGSITDTRTADIQDVFANATGSAIAALIIVLLTIYRNKVSANN